jgi:small-conductance mechanosensitive channel
MQSMAINFISGLILLFNQNIRKGDVIQLHEGQKGLVTSLGQLSTRVITPDRAEIVVPNGELLANQVTNWTLSDRTMRLNIPVAVARDSDADSVRQVLLAVALDNPQVMEHPEPVVLFLNFGDSSLDFELQVSIANVEDKTVVRSALNWEIDRRFRAEAIEIPFPQRDLRLRNVDAMSAAHLPISHRDDDI